MKREELLKVLKRVSPALETGSKSFESGLVTFGDGFIGAFDGQMIITCPIPLKFERECSVVAKSILSLLGKMKDEEVNLTLKSKKNILEIQTANRLFKAKLYDKDFPKVEINPDKFSSLPKDFVNALGMCAFSMSRTPMTVDLSTICITDKYAYSTDGLRASRFTFVSSFPMPQGMETVLLPYELVSVILRIDQPITKVYIKGGTIHFKGRGNEGVTISHALSSGDYPVQMVDKYLGKSEEETYYALPHDISKIMERVMSIVPPAKQGAITDSIVITPISEKEIKITFESDVGSYEETGEVDVPFPDDRSMILRAEFLNEVIQFTKRFRFTTDEKGVVFVRNKFKHILTFLKPQEELAKEE